MTRDDEVDGVTNAANFEVGFWLWGLSLWEPLKFLHVLH